MPHKILVIDDDPLIRLAAETWLKAAGYQVAACADGASALRLAGTEAPDAVLLDLQLGDEDGFAVAAALARIFAGRAAPVIFMSASEPAAGASALFLLKPLSRTALVAKLAAAGLPPAP